jgi:NADPH:quinone reductase-like Zn-dependent oxidoreductase
MKAAFYSNYGPPEVVKVMEVPAPVPSDDQLLVRVYGSTVNRTDSGFRSAQYFISRFFSGLFKPTYGVLGSEFSGTVIQIGKNVTSFAVGDQVFGFNDPRFGGHGEFLTIGEKEFVTHVPKNLPLNECTAIAEGAHYAQSIIRAANVQPRQNVMVYGANGAIGSAAAQLFKHMKATVTAVCNTKKWSSLKDLERTKSSTTKRKTSQKQTLNFTS